MKFPTDVWLQEFNDFLNVFPTDLSPAMKVKRESKVRPVASHLYGVVVRELKPLIWMLENDHVLAHNDTIIEELEYDWEMIQRVASIVCKYVCREVKTYQELHPYHDKLFEFTKSHTIMGKRMDDLGVVVKEHSERPFIMKIQSDVDNHVKNSVSLSRLMQ